MACKTVRTRVVVSARSQPSIPRGRASGVRPIACADSALIVRRFQAALAGGGLRISWSESRERPSDCRLVMQVHVGEKLYDWFFNARTWYRTQFRQESERGNAYNRDLIAAIQVVLSASQRSRPGTSLRFRGWGRVRNRLRECTSIARPRSLEVLALRQAATWGRAGARNDPSGSGPRAANRWDCQAT
jgi:hypothetical protein